MSAGRIVMALSASATLLAGCASASSDPTAGPGTTTRATVSTTLENGLIPDPNNPGNVMLDDIAPDPNAFAFGQEVSITDAGFSPRELVAKVDREVLITNKTSAPKAVSFINGPAGETGLRETGPIAPGESFRFTAKIMVSLTFRLTDQPDVRGAVLIDVANFEP